MGGFSKCSISDETLKKGGSNNNACMPTLTENKGFVVYTKQWNVFCSMISDPENRVQTQKPVCAHDTEHMQRPGTASKHTGQTTEVDPVTVREKLSRHSSLSVSTMTHLCSGLSSPYSCCLLSTDRDRKRQNRPTSHCKAKTLLFMLHCLVQSLIPALLGLCLSLLLSLVPLAFSLQRDKAAVEEVAHPRG